VNEPEEIEGDEDVLPFDWRGLLVKLLLGGVVLWVLAGAVRIILSVYSVPGEGFIGLGEESYSGTTLRVVQAATVVESIAFKVWVAAAVLLGFVWLRDRSS
jgi:hypothetical protein